MILHRKADTAAIYGAAVETCSHRGEGTSCQDLHDNLGQVLGFINLQAQGIRKELDNADIDIVSQKLDRLVNVSQEAHNDIREYIRSIRNTEALGKDFMEGLLKDINRFEEQSGLKVKLDIPSGFTGDGLRPDIRINTLNIVREALNNTRKHSKLIMYTCIFSIKGAGMLL